MKILRSDGGTITVYRAPFHPLSELTMTWLSYDYKVEKDHERN